MFSDDKLTKEERKRDLWKEVQQKRKEKEELGWNSGYSVDDLKEDYDDLIPPSRYDKIFISQIGEMEFIVDDEDKENYFEIYDLEPDFDEYHYDDRYKNEIGIYRIDEKSNYKREEILERVRNETWIKFSQENRDWLERQEELLTTIKEKNKERKELNQEYQKEFLRRKENGDWEVLEYIEVQREMTTTRIKLKRSNLNIYQDFEEENNYPQSFPDYDGSSFENHHNQGRTKQFERISKRKRNRGIDIRTEFIRDPLRTTTSIVNRSIYG